MEQKDHMRQEVIRTLLFVLVLLTVAEIVAPYFHISFSDPLAVTAFITAALGGLIKQWRTDNKIGGSKRTLILVMSTETFNELDKKIEGSALDLGEVHVVKDENHAIKTIECDKSKNKNVLAKVSDWL